MNTNQPAPEPTQQAQDAQYYRRVLHDLIDMGTDIARIVHTQATKTQQPDHAQTFDRIARAIRRTILLAQKIAEPPAAPRTQTQSRAQSRRQILRKLEDAIQDGAKDRTHAESLHAELLDRLDGPDLDEDLLNRPIADIIADIRRDLGLAMSLGPRPWKRRTPQDIALLHARAARPGPAPPTSQPQTPPRARGSG